MCTPHEHMRTEDIDTNSQSNVHSRTTHAMLSLLLQLAGGGSTTGLYLELRGKLHDLQVCAALCQAMAWIFNTHRLKLVHGPLENQLVPPCVCFWADAWPGHCLHSWRPGTTSSMPCLQSVVQRITLAGWASHHLHLWMPADRHLLCQKTEVRTCTLELDARYCGQ